MYCAETELYYQSLGIDQPFATPDALFLCCPTHLISLTGQPHTQQTAEPFIGLLARLEVFALCGPNNENVEDSQTCKHVVTNAPALRCNKNWMFFASEVAKDAARAKI